MKGFIKIKYLRVTKLNEMKIKEIFKKIDTILKENEDLPALSEISKGKKRAKSTLQKLFGLFKKIIKTQYAIIASYLKEEFKIAIKNDLKLFVVIIGLLTLIVVIFVVFWLFISIAIAAYFYEMGNSILHSVLYTMAVHLGVMIILSIGIFVASKNFKTHKVYGKIKKSINIKK